MTKCIRCGKPCADTDQLCDDCKIWYQEKRKAREISLQEQGKNDLVIGSGREEAGFDKEYVTAEKEDGEWDEKKDKRRKYVILFSVLAVLTITGSITAARFIQEHHSADAAKTDMLVNEVAVQITGISEDEIVILSTEEEIGLKPEREAETETETETEVGTETETETETEVETETETETETGIETETETETEMETETETETESETEVETETEPKRARETEIKKEITMEEMGDGSFYKSGKIVQDNAFILPESAMMYLTEADLSDLTLKGLCYAKNEIYARYGRKFKSQELNQYFTKQSWYNGIYEPNESTDAQIVKKMNEFENYNKDLLWKLEQEMGTYQLDAEDIAGGGTVNK